ncbi:phage tail spike protein [Enterococcus cecorum]|uniref:phage tail spike protein n=1 Tax=Enterococcus cecorum TaxID=44008 RepID=UPI001F0651CF|nr:phage tail spike protein [Enterococcus cecorum]
MSFSQETLLQRIFKLADNFNAEIKIYPILNDDHSIQKIVLDIYKKDVGDQGIGNYHPEIRLRYGNEVSTVKRTVDIMQLKTAIKPIGNNGLTLVGYQVDVRDSDNKQLYYSPEPSGYIYAPQARDRFPSNKTGSNANDFYIEYTKTYSTDSQSELANLALADLKVDSEPNVSYETELFYPDAKIGDTIRIDDDGYQPKLMLEARITKLEICFTDPTKNKVTFSNFVELKSEIDPALIAKMQELAEQNKVYNAQILTDNTVIFKNNQGETTLIARVLDGIKDITDRLTITWLKGDLEVGNGKNLRVTAADVNGVQLYRFNAFKDGKLIGQAQISVADVVDGTDGQPGADGENAINVYLTNENITLKADTQGNLKSGQLDLASGQMVVVDGPNVVTSEVSYSIVDQTGCTATIDGSGNYRLTALNADSASVILRASYKGTALQKTFNVNKLYDAIPGKNGSDGQDGKSPIVGYLTNENFIIQTNQDGSLNAQSLANANGYFNVYQGENKLTNGVTFSIVSQTGVNVSLNATTGYYAVNSMSAEFGTAIFKAVYNKVEIQKQLMVVKNKSAIGVVVADNPPSNPLVGQLWKNTGYGNGYYYGTTYYYTGSSWQVYLFYAANIQADNLAALSANLGNVTAGTITGSVFTNDFKRSYTSTLNRTGTTTLSDGKLRIDYHDVNKSTGATSANGSYMEYSETGIDFAENDGTETGKRLELNSNRISLGNSNGTLYADPSQMKLSGDGYFKLQPKYFLGSNGDTNYQKMSWTTDGFELQPVNAFGYPRTGNTGIEIGGDNSYVDFKTPSNSTVDYQSRVILRSNREFEMLHTIPNKVLRVNNEAAGGETHIVSKYSNVGLMCGNNVNVRNPSNTAWKAISASGFVNASDEKWKYNIKDIPPRLEQFKNIDFKAYRLWAESGKYQEGIIANDNIELPFINKGYDGYSVDTYAYITFIGKATQEYIAQNDNTINELKSENVELKNKVDNLTTELETIKQQLSTLLNK